MKEFKTKPDTCRGLKLAVMGMNVKLDIDVEL